MLETTEFKKVGIMGKPHGVSGETTVRLLPDMASERLHPTFIYLLINGGLVPYRVENFRDKSVDVLLVKLPLLKAQDKMRGLQGCEVFLAPGEIDSPDSPAGGEDALAGYVVTDVNRGRVGTMIGIQEISGNPLLVIAGEAGEILIPATEEFVLEIDDEAKQITVDTPEGLLDINLENE